MDIPDITTSKKPGPLDPFRRAVLRGLAVLLPPLLTIVIFLWVWNTVTNYLLAPMEVGAERLLVNHYQKRIVAADQIPADRINSDPDDEVPDAERFSTELGYQQAEDDRFVLAEDYDFLQTELGFEPPMKSADEFYQVFVKRKFLQWYIVIPFFLSIFLLMLYLLGKFLAAGVGRFFWMQFERVIKPATDHSQCLLVGQTGDRFSCSANEKSNTLASWRSSTHVKAYGR